MRKLVCGTLTQTPYLASETELIVSGDELHDLRVGGILAIYDNSYGDTSTAKKMGRLEYVRVKGWESSVGNLYVLRAQFGTKGIEFDDGALWRVISVPMASSDEADVTDYGDRAVAGFDSTEAFQSMADDLGVVSIPFSETPFEIDSVITTRSTVFKAKNGQTHVKLREPIRRNAPGIVLAHDQSGIDRGVHIDGNDTGRSCIRIAADDCFAYVTCENVTSDSESQVSTSGVEITGDRYRFDVRGYHFRNTGHPNESSPRVVTVQAEADDFDGSVHAEDVGCVFLTGSNTGTGRLSQLYARAAEDNGIYQLGGSLTVIEMIYHGNEEGIVVGGRLFINNYHVIGEGSSSISLNGGDHLEVQNFEISMDGEDSLQSAMRLRAGRNFGDVIIRNVKGRMRGNTMIRLPEGFVRSLTIDRFDLEYEYDLSKSGPITQFCNLTAVEQFNLKDFHVKIIDKDDVLTSSNFFEVRLPSVSEQSYLIDPKFWTVTSNGDNSPALVRIIRFAQERIEYTGLNIQTNVGPYGREEGYLGESVSGRNVAAAPPESGSYRIGTVIENSRARSGNVAGWEYTSEGWRVIQD